MKTVVIETARTDKGYSGACSILDGWVVAHSGSFEEFKRYVQDSIDFYIESAKEDGDDYHPVFDGEYTLEFKFDMQSLLQFYQGIFSFSALENITGVNQKQAAQAKSRTA